MRSTTNYVIFQHPFFIRGMDREEPPGTYTVITEEEQIPGLSFLAWRRISTVIRLPANEKPTAQEQYTAIDPEGLAAALKQDTTDVGCSVNPAVKTQSNVDRGGTP